MDGRTAPRRVVRLTGWLLVGTAALSAVGVLAAACGGGTKDDGAGSTGGGGTTPTGPLTIVDLQVSGQGTVAITGDPAEQPVSCDGASTPCHAELHGAVTLAAKNADGWVFLDYLDPSNGQVLTSKSTYVLKAGSTTSLSALFVPLGNQPDGGGVTDGGCPNGKCPTTLAGQLSSAASLRLGDADVYFLGSIEKVSKTGGSPATLVGGTVSTFAADATGLYFLDGNGTTVKTAGLDGSGVKDLAPADGTQHTQSIALDDARVYWATQSADQHCTGVMALAKDGSGAATKVAEACDQTDTVSPFGLAVDGTSVYWTSIVTPSFSSGTVWRAPKGGAGAAGEQLAFGKSSASRPLVQGSTLYWMQDGIMKIDLPDCKPLCTATHAAKTQGVSAFAVDDASIYAVGDGGLVRVDKASLVETQLANEAGHDVVVDATSIFWSGGAPGAASIYALAK
jgi:hypothetical protein